MEICDGLKSRGPAVVDYTSNSYPVPAQIDHVIIYCEPGQKVRWIDYGMGITIEQYVVVSALPDASTQIHTFGEFVGAPSTLVIDGTPVEDLVKHFLRDWYTNFAAACDRSAASPA